MKTDRLVVGNPGRNQVPKKRYRVMSLVQLDVLPQSFDAALLLLRVWVGGSLFLKHGLDKLLGYSQMVSHFPDPFHLGSQVTLTIALFSDAVCSILVILGLATRWAALFIFANILVAWATIVHFQFFGHGVSPGEILFLYLGSFLTICLAGPGRYSFDTLLHDRFENPSAPRSGISGR